MTVEEFIAEHGVQEDGPFLKLTRDLLTELVCGPAAPASASKPGPEAAGTPLWEYNYGIIKPASGDLLKEELNKIGRFGWILCSVVIHDMPVSDSNLALSGPQTVPAFFYVIRRPADCGLPRGFDTGAKPAQHGGEQPVAKPWKLPAGVR